MGGLADALWSHAKPDARGLVTAVVQHAESGVVLMVAAMSQESLARTLEDREVTFYSRSRQQLWRKGETSGNTLALVDVRIDCDGDALLVRALPAGPTCHTGKPSCFWRRLDEDGERSTLNAQRSTLNAQRSTLNAERSTLSAQRSTLNAQRSTLNAERSTPDDAIFTVDDGPIGSADATLAEVFAVILARRAGHGVTSTSGRSYVRELLAAGPAAVAAKIREEADELARAIEHEADDRVAAEAADLLFHALVGLAARDLTPADPARVLAARFGTSGIDEKARR